MGTYREQLLKETYGNAGSRIYGKPEEGSSGFLTVFKIKFSVCLLLFAGFAWLSLTGNSLGNVTAEQIRQAVEEDSFREEFARWQETLEK